MAASRRRAIWRTSSSACNTRKTPISDVASHHQAISICHAVNIAMRLGRTVTYDAVAEDFVDDPQASGFVSRPQRKGYEING